MKKEYKNLKKKITLSALTATLCYLPFEVQGMGGGGGCVTGNIGITVITAPLNFGVIGACTATAGTVTVDPRGTLTTAGCIASTAGIVQQAGIRVRGGQSSNSIRIFIRVPASAIISDAGNSMNATNFGLRDGGGTVATITQRGGQTRTYDMGSTLNVNGGQAGGTYTGTATVSATCT